MKQQLIQRTRLALVATVTFILCACGGGGTIPYPGVAGSSGSLGTTVVTTGTGTSTATIQAGLRPLSTEFSTRNAVAYSPYRTTLGPNGEVVTASEILQDLNLLLATNLKLIRLYDSSNMVSQTTLQLIRANGLDIKVILGAYLQSGNESANQAELARAVNLANTYSDIVLAVSVGNENMVNWSSNAIAPKTMAGYITTVRNQVTQPVTSDDNWAFYASANGNSGAIQYIAPVIDYLSIHTYPIEDSVQSPSPWNWQQTATPAGSQRATAMMNASIVWAQSNYASVYNAFKSNGLGNLPIMIGETGWKAIASGNPPETYRAHPVNQGMYYASLLSWMANPPSGLPGPKSIVYFEGFDEPWKGSDDNWGLFNVNRQARYAIQSICTSCTPETPLYSSTDAVYYLPPATSGAITGSPYNIYDTSAVSGSVSPSFSLTWNGWNSPWTVALAYPAGTSANPYGGYVQVTPVPASWGWGVQYNYNSGVENLSNFASTGVLHVSVKTSYPGALEFGFLTAVSNSSAYADAYMPVSPGQYGYVNDGAWHNVAIPISALMAHAPQLPNNPTPDLTQVAMPFIVGDIYSQTGNTAGSTVPVSVDNIYWTK